MYQEKNEKNDASTCDFVSMSNNSLLVDQCYLLHAYFPDIANAWNLFPLQLAFLTTVLQTVDFSLGEDDGLV